VSNAAFRVLRLVSITICVLVSASFLVFAVNQTKTASNHQQSVLANEGGEESTASKKEGSLHRTLDETAKAFTNPFSGIVANSSGEWAVRSFELLMALLVYGFGLGYLARVIRVRV
jgi:hypothetical protein